MIHALLTAFFVSFLCRHTGHASIPTYVAVFGVSLTLTRIRSLMPWRYGQSVYYVGGFGSEHFIGYIPLDVYQNASLADHAAELGVGGRLLVTQD